MSSKDSDSVKWILIPLTTNLLECDTDIAFGNDEMSINAPIPTSKSTPNAANTPLLEKQKSRLLSLDSNDDMSIVLSPAAGQDSQPFSIGSCGNRDDMSISTSANGVIPYANLVHEALPAVNISLSRFFDEEEGWSLFMPTIEDTNIETENRPIQPTTQTPTMFRAMSIESMYSVWSNGTTFAGDAVDDENRPSKRLKSVNKDGDTTHVDKSRGNMDKKLTYTIHTDYCCIDLHIDIYSDIRRNIVY